MSARASILAQIRLGTVPAVVFSAPSTGVVSTEITRLVFANTTAGTVTASLHHDVTGSSSFDASNALLFSKSIPANDSLTLEAMSEDTGITLRQGERLGASASAADSVTLTIYGVTAMTTVTAEGRRR